MFSLRTLKATIKDRAEPYGSHGEKLFEKISKLESILLSVSLVAILIIGSLTISGHINTQAFAISSMAIIGACSMVTLLNKESKIDKIFEFVRLALFMVVLSLTLKGIISLNVTAPLLVGLAGFSFCCCSNSTLLCQKFFYVAQEKTEESDQ